MSVGYTRYREAFVRLSRDVESEAASFEATSRDLAGMAEQGPEFMEGRYDIPDDVDERRRGFDSRCLSMMVYLRDDVVAGWANMFEQRWFDLTENGRVSFMDEFRELATAAVDAIESGLDGDEFVGQWLAREHGTCLPEIKAAIGREFDYERETKRESYIDDVKQESASLHKEVAYDIAAIDQTFMTALAKMDEDEMARLLAAVRKVNDDFASDIEAQHALAALREKVLESEGGLRRGIDSAARLPDSADAWGEVSARGSELEAALTSAQDVVMGLLAARPDKRAPFMENIGQPYQAPIASARKIAEMAREARSALTAGGGSM